MLNPNNDRLDELKNFFRQATKLCHPDTVSEEFKEDAHALFIELRNAYDLNNLEKIKQILIDLQRGKYFKGYKSKGENALFSFFDFYPISTIYCEMKLNSQKTVYDKIESLARAEIFNYLNNSITINKQKILSKIEELRLASYCFNNVNHNGQLIEESVKDSYILNEILKRNTTKILVVSRFLRVINHFSTLLQRKDVSHSVLHGGTLNRKDIVEQFNDAKRGNNILLCSSRALGAINLLATNIFILDTSGMKGELINVVSRSTRKKEVFAFVTKNSIEERLIKLQNFDNPLDDYQQLLSNENLIKLFGLS